MNQKSVWWLALLALLGFAAGAAFWWQQQQLPPLPKASEASLAQAAPAVASPAAASAAAASTPGIRYPIEAAGSATSNAPSAALPQASGVDAYLSEALAELLGRKAVLSLLSVDHFAVRVVTTVDNLARPHAASRLWPVNPMASRFVTTPAADGRVIGADNAARYTAFVQLIGSVDAARTVALYKRLYPLFQRAYESLGYAGGYFNDRLVEVIDHLLETPELAGPLKVRLTEVKGPVQPARPWVMYEFEDPSLEARSAGQKMLLRMGPSNARPLKAKLAELRRLIVRAEVAR